MPIPSEMICDCLRCGHGWVKRVAGRPVRCPKCKQPNWDVAVGGVRMGRPPKTAAKTKVVRRTPERRSEIAKAAAAKRWRKKKASD